MQYWSSSWQWSGTDMVTSDNATVVALQYFCFYFNLCFEFSANYIMLVGFLASVKGCNILPASFTKLLQFMSWRSFKVLTFLLPLWYLIFQTQKGFVPETLTMGCAFMDDFPQLTNHQLITYSGWKQRSLNLMKCMGGSNVYACWDVNKVKERPFEW